MELGNESGRIIKQAISDFVYNTVNEAIKYIPCNHTKYGRITAVSDKNYTIIINNATYTRVNALSNLSGTLNLNDTVICIVPENQMSRMFIVGKIDE